MQASTTQNMQPRHSVFIDYYRILRQRKWTLAYCVLGAVILVFLFNTFFPAVYEGEASILYQAPRDSKFALELNQAFYGSSDILNIIEQIKSRTLAENVVTALPPEVLKKLDLPKKLPSGVTPEKYLGESLRKKLDVNLVRGTDILKIKFKANEAGLAQVITNTYIDQMVAWDMERNREEISGIRNFIDRQFSLFQKKLNESEELLRDFKEKNKMISLNEASTEVLQRLTETEFEYNRVKTEREAMQDRLQFIEQKKQKFAPKLALDTNTQTQELKKKILDLELQYAAKQQNGVQPDQPEMVALKKEANILQQSLVQELLNRAQEEHLVDPLSQLRDLLQESVVLEVNLETNKAKEKQLKKILTEYEAELQKLPGQELELARLLRSRDVNNKIYSVLLEKREEARITEAGKVGTIHVIDMAEMPKSPVKPKKMRNFAISLILGLILGVGMAFFIDSLDSSLKTQSDVENLLHLPVLTTIPAIQANGNLAFGKKSPDKGNGYAKKQFFDLNLNSPVSEAFRAFELNFSFINTDQNFKTIMVSSPGVGDGKTLTAINLAEVFAQSGYKTLLLDCDLRRPRINKVLETVQMPGITDVLINKSDLSQAVHPIAENLSFLPSGTMPPNPSEMLKSAKMKSLLAELARDYDLILIDTPPVLPVIDAMALGAKVDGVCLVVRSGHTSQDAAMRAKQMLEASHTRIIGVILNGVDSNEFRSYNHYWDQDNHKKNHKEVATEA